MIQLVEAIRHTITPSINRILPSLKEIQCMEHTQVKMNYITKFKSIRNRDIKGNTSTLTGNLAPLGTNPYARSLYENGPMSYPRQLQTVWEHVATYGILPAEFGFNDTVCTKDGQKVYTTELCTIPTSSNRPRRNLNRSDYSQHGYVRTGRWSFAEESYAKAMIEAFKSGHIPLNRRISLRRFLSEILVCHPMRVSKKFAGYVRKYHWYRAAAGGQDATVRKKVLSRLQKLENQFWESVVAQYHWQKIQ